MLSLLKSKFKQKFYRTLKHESYIFKGPFIRVPTKKWPGALQFWSIWKKLLCRGIKVDNPDTHHWRRSGVFFVNLERISHFSLVFILLALSREVFAGMLQKWIRGLVRLQVAFLKCKLFLKYKV